jgi:hypothetical protein
MTRYRECDKHAVLPYQPTGSLQKKGMPLYIKPTEKPVILLATALITSDNIFMNGLFQNIYVLYRMFEAMSCIPIMCVNEKPQSLEKIPHYMHDLRIMTCEEFHKTPIPVKLYIDIGMSVNAELHKYLKMCGAKICKLYLGNILNIDIETPIFMPSMMFAHHVKGDMDEIWVSPHYHQHDQYARRLNYVDIEKSGPLVVPYVWDSQVLTADNTRQFAWRAAKNPEEDVFLILEPNISFQKSSLIPLMMIEAWYRKNKSWKGKVILCNGERLQLVPFFRETIWNQLDIVKDGRVEVKGRMDILTLLKTYPSAIPICHQINNEYNYMALEFFHTGYPVIHNASDWSAYGYSYTNSSIEEGVRAIELVRKGHDENREVYRAHAKTLIWRHSPYNPEIHKQWATAAGL